MSAVHVPVTVLPHGAGLPLPSYATEGAAGLDVLLATDGAVVLAAGERRAVPTGISVAVPQGYEAQLRPRSGLALRHGLTVLNSPGTIDADYRGEVQVILANLGAETVILERGQRIAQLVLAPVAHLVWQPVAALPASPRGTGGFGSTGL